MPCASRNGWIPQAWLDLKDPRGIQLKQENALNLNSACIVLFLVPFSYLVARIKVEHGKPLKVIATGGLAHLFERDIPGIDQVDADLTIKGLILIHARNQKSRAA